MKRGADVCRLFGRVSKDEIINGLYASPLFAAPPTPYPIARSPATRTTPDTAHTQAHVSQRAWGQSGESVFTVQRADSDTTQSTLSWIQHPRTRSWRRADLARADQGADRARRAWVQKQWT